MQRGQCICHQSNADHLPPKTCSLWSLSPGPKTSMAVHHHLCKYLYARYLPRYLPRYPGRYLGMYLSASPPVLGQVIVSQVSGCFGKSQAETYTSWLKMPTSDWATMRPLCSDGRHVYIWQFSKTGHSDMSGTRIPYMTNTMARYRGKREEQKRNMSAIHVRQSSRRATLRQPPPCAFRLQMPPSSVSAFLGTITAIEGGWIAI